MLRGIARIIVLLKVLVVTMTIACSVERSHVIQTNLHANHALKLGFVQAHLVISIQVTPALHHYAVVMTRVRIIAPGHACQVVQMIRLMQHAASSELAAFILMNATWVMTYIK